MLPRALSATNGPATWESRTEARRAAGTTLSASAFVRALDREGSAFVFRPQGGLAGRIPEGTHLPRPDPRRADHAGLHRCQRLSGSQGRPDLRLVDPGSGHFHGRVARLQRRDDLRKQHRADGRLGSGHALLDHLRLARPRDGGLVDGLSVLGIVRRLRGGRHPRRDVHRAAAPRARNGIRPALSRRRCRRRSAQGRLGLARGQRRGRGRRRGK